VTTSLLLLLALAAADPQAGAVGKADVGERSADARDKVLCKKFLETGSLVKGTRICKTKAEWEKDRDNARASAITQSTSCQTPGCF
jgi:hypothetical protein